MNSNNNGAFSQPSTVMPKLEDNNNPSIWRTAALGFNAFQSHDSNNKLNNEYAALKHYFPAHPGQGAVACLPLSQQPVQQVQQIQQQAQYNMYNNGTSTYDGKPILHTPTVAPKPKKPKKKRQKQQLQQQQCQQCSCGALPPPPVEKPYSCDQCQAGFTRKEHLTRHLRIHTGEKPYECGQCNSTFGRKEHLKRHTRIHTGERPYECRECALSFSRKEHLLKHTHHQPHSSAAIVGASGAGGGPPTPPSASTADLVSSSPSVNAAAAAASSSQQQQL